MPGVLFSSGLTALGEGLTAIKENDITGTRWWCGVCLVYDLCDKCYKTIGHDHRMLAIEHSDDVRKEVRLCFPKPNFTSLSLWIIVVAINVQFSPIE